MPYGIVSKGTGVVSLRRGLQTVFEACSTEAATHSKSNTLLTPKEKQGRETRIHVARSNTAGVDRGPSTGEADRKPIRPLRMLSGSIGWVDIFHPCTCVHVSALRPIGL